MKTYKKGLGLLLILALLFAWSFIGEADPINTRRGDSGVGWVLTASDDDVDASAELITELDTTFVQMAAASTIYAVSSSSADTTQTLYVSGITSAGKKVTTSWTLLGATAVAASSATYSYVDQTWVSAECAGTVTVNVYDAGATLINSIEIGSLKGDVAQHFNGELTSYIQSWWATSVTADEKTVELRHYPDDADCLDPTDGFMLLDKIYMAHNVYTSDPHVFANSSDSGMRVPAGGWLAVYGTGGAVNQEATVTVIGFDRSY